MSNLHIELVTLEAMPYLTRYREPTIKDLDSALGAGYRRLASQLPFDEVCDIYCDLDARWDTYRNALRDRFAAYAVEVLP